MQGLGEPKLQCGMGIWPGSDHRCDSVTYICNIMVQLFDTSIGMSYSMTTNFGILMLSVASSLQRCQTMKRPSGRACPKSASGTTTPRIQTDTFQPCLPPWIPDDGYEDAQHIGGMMLYLVLKGCRPGVYTSW